MALSRADRVLLLAFGAVVVSFVSATLYGQQSAAKIEQAALSIQEKAAPSIHRLANARAELRRLQLLVHRAVDSGIASSRAAEIETGRALLESEIVEYERLPRYPAEVNVWRGVQSALSAMDADISVIMSALRSGDVDAARAGQGHLDASSELVTRRLSAAINVNVAEASSLAADIRANRRRGLASSIELDAAGVLLALVAAALALRVSRSHARVVEAYRTVAERRAEELDAFATKMAHDVRSPLAAAGFALDIIDRTRSADERVRRAVVRGRGALTQTSKIIEGLLDFARAGARPVPGARASVSDAAEDVATVMRARATEIGAEIVVMAGSQSLVGCAEGVLASALGNLIGNALTYVDGAHARRVTVEIADEGREVKATVSDTGPGLPPEIEPEALFEPYVRGQSARGRGLGLGLATVKRIVDAHGGRIGVRSSPSGCQFWFTLPTASGDHADDRPRRPSG